MQVTMTKEGSADLVRPFGPIIANELDDLERELSKLEKAWAPRVVIDMNEAPFLDSAGLDLLCQFHRRMAERGLQLKLCGLTEMTTKILELTRIIRRFQVFPDTNTAVRSFL